MVVSAKHLSLKVVADFVYQIYLKERFSTYEVPHNALISHILFLIKDIVNGCLCYLPGHPLFRVLPHEVAILASQLAVLRNDEGDVLRYAGLPILSL